MEGARTEIVIRLIPGEPEPRGELRVAGEPERTFAGWIGLISGLESIIHAQPTVSGRTDGG
jgi:hypothetical protein